MIGVYDSGVGGLSVWRELRRTLLGVPMVYFADQAHVPYGPRTVAEVQHLAHAATGLLIRRGARLIVVACNTATAAALDTLRVNFPDMPFVGIEPAIKPAAVATRTGVIAVVATAATLASARYSTLISRYAAHVRVIGCACPEWVLQVESMRLSGARAHAVVAAQVLPLLGAGVDVLALGCTHFPFLADQIMAIAAGAGVPLKVIDPAPAVASQAKRLWGDLTTDANAADVFLTTGSLPRFARAVVRLVGTLQGSRIEHVAMAQRH